VTDASRPVYALSLHADYACRHSGECCTAGWAIPVEPELRHLLRVERLEPRDDGACEQYDADARRCRVHRDYGPALLPAACHHFPRRALIDDRGTFVTLSHFCPTAAEQLFRTDVRLEIVEAPAGFPASRQYDGLDGRDAWPPLLRPGVLFDHDSFTRWERFIVATLAVDDWSAEAALRHIAVTAERLRAWTVAAGPLPAWTERILADDGPEPVQVGSKRAADRCIGLATETAEIQDVYGHFADVQSFARVAATVPAGLAAPELPPTMEILHADLVAPRWHEWQLPVRHYLAAKAFGSWCAYQAQGIRTMVAELMTAEMVLRVEAARACAAAGRPLDRPLMLTAIRQADRLLMHLADRTALTAWLGETEQRCRKPGRVRAAFRR
jgi:hypothetical protein